LNVRDCAPYFAMKALAYRNDFDAVGYGKACGCAPVFNFVRLLPIGDNQSREWVDGSWVMNQMGHENRMGHMGHGSLGVDP